MKTVKELLEIKDSKEENKNEKTVFQEFLDILNPPRIKLGLQPVTHGRLRFLLQHLDGWDKAIFLGSCKDAKNPSAYFWWALKPKK